MNILNICVNGVYTDGYTYHENLLPKYHKRIGHDVYVMASEYEFDKKGNIRKADKREYIDENGINVKRLRIIGDRPITDRFKRFEGFSLVISELKPDIIFCHLFQFLDVKKVIAYKKKRPNIRLYFDSHADKINSAHGILSTYILHGMVWKYFAKKAYQAANAFYGVSPARVDFLRSMYGLPADKTKLLVMGADDDMVRWSENFEIQIQTRMAYEIDEDDFLIVTGGRLDKSKVHVLNLMRVIQKNFPKIKLIVFGPVSDDMLNDVKKLAVDNIKYVGWIDEKEAYRLFSICKIAVFPCTHSVYWEQVAGQGKPMIIRYWSGFEHLNLGGNVRYLLNSSEEEIRMSIAEILKENHYVEMKKVAIQKGQKVFSYYAIAKESIEENDK